MADKQKGRTSQETEESITQKTRRDNVKRQTGLNEQKQRQRALDMEEPDIWNLPTE